MTSETKSARPVRTYVAYGRGGIISAAVWKRERQFANGKIGHYPTVSLGRRYKDPQTGEWKSSSSFSLGDLAKLRDVVARVLQDMEQPFQGAGQLQAEDWPQENALSRESFAAVSCGGRNEYGGSTSVIPARAPPRGLQQSMRKRDRFGPQEGPQQQRGDAVVVC